MRPAFLLLAALLVLSACGRPLTPQEVAFLGTVQGSGLDTSKVRLFDDLAVGAPITVPASPRVTCQQRLYPPPAASTIQTGTAAMTIFDGIHFRSDYYAGNFLADWPKTINLPAAMLLAHEMTHVWQWQHRDVTHYFPLKAALEHVRSRDPYLFDPDTPADFLSLGYEQQGSVVEEYVCCRTLAPHAARTSRLHDMLRRVFPDLPPISPIAEDALLPWRGVQLAGICD